MVYIKKKKKSSLFPPFSIRQGAPCRGDLVLYLYGSQGLRRAWRTVAAASRRLIDTSLDTTCATNTIPQQDFVKTLRANAAPVECEQGALRESLRRKLLFIWMGKFWLV